MTALAPGVRRVEGRREVATQDRAPRRPLHPGAWWLWALGLGVASTATTNPLVLLLLLAAVGNVVVVCRRPSPWDSAFRVFLVVGLVTLGLRVVAIAFLSSQPAPGHLLVDVPRWDVGAGVSVGGPITVEKLVGAAYVGLRLAVFFACLGAANALTHPTRLLKSVPPVLHEAALVVTVAVTLAPQMVANARRIRDARRLRGRPTRGLRGLQGMARPVLEGALDTALDLAAAMEARGHGRRADVSARRRLLTGSATVVGLLALALGLYGMLGRGPVGSLAAPALGGGAMLTALGLVSGGRRSVRTTYRPDPWRSPEWLVAGSGIAAAVLLHVSSGLQTTAEPLEVPTLPFVALLATGLALLPLTAGRAS